jgi:hypothetical protein
MKTLTRLSCFYVCLLIGSGAEPLLHPDDRVAICGESISGYIEDYLLMAQPVAGLDIAQFNWVAQDPATFLARLDADVLPFKPTVVLLSFGPGDANTQAKAQTDLIEALKKAGVRVIVIGSAPCVDSVAYQNDPAKAAAENQRLAALAQIDKDVAAKEGAAYADVYGATMAAMLKEKALNGESYAFESDRDVFNMAMAGAYLQALGCDGPIGTITVDFAADKAEGTPGQKIVSMQGGLVTVRSTVPAFWFPGHNIAPTAPRPDPLLTCIPFNDESNRYLLIVKNLPTARAKVYLDDQSHDFSAEELAKGVNLAKDMPADHPFGLVTTLVNGGVSAQQYQEQLAGEALLQGKPDPQADAKREAALQAAKNRIDPVQATIRIQPLAPAEAPSAGPIPVILDTDLGGDVDDDGALAVLNKLADEGKCTILACVGSSLDEDKASAAAIDAINTYYGRPHLPIGMYHGDAYGKTRYKSRYTAALRDEFPHTAKPDDQQPSSLDVYRKTLAAAPDGSVKIVSIGFLINLEDLLKSPPDANSPLSGLDLVKKKVRQLVVMGGAYPQGHEWNFGGDSSGPYTQYVTENWPTPILFSGFEIGAAILTDPRLASTPANDPVRRAYELQDPKLTGGHQSWDLTAVLAAVEDPNLYWEVGTGGYCQVMPSGADQWHATPDHGHSYLIEKVPPSDVAKALNNFLGMPPKTP